ncbi:MAG: lysozyme inhibitor LprI family protein [Verrucomicrobiota bacterium]
MKWSVLVLVLLSSIGALAEDLASAKSAYGEKDRDLNAVWSSLKAVVAESEMATLTKEQKDWLEYRDHKAESLMRFNGDTVPEDIKTSAMYWEYCALLTGDRTSILRAILSYQKGEELEWSGEWNDGYDGSLWIGAIRGREAPFLISCVRGPTAHVGELAGTAVINGNIARVTIREEGMEEETWLTFIMRGGKLEVIGQNTQYFHGARAYFDGEYYRVGELTAKQSAEIHKVISLP